MRDRDLARALNLADVDQTAVALIFMTMIVSIAIAGALMGRFPRKHEQ